MDGQHLDERFFDLITGEISSRDRARAEEHLASCDRCRMEHARVTELLSAVALGEPPESPPAELRQRVLDRVSSDRFELVREKLVELFDLTGAATDALLASLNADETWIDGPLPGLQIAHAQAGSKRAAAYTGFVRMAPGLAFPPHRHLGAETMLVMAGGLRLHGERVVHAGDYIESSAGSAHGFVVLDDDECIAAVVQYNGIEFGVKLA